MQSLSTHHFEDVLRCIARQLQQSRTACQHHQLRSCTPPYWPMLVPIHVSMLVPIHVSMRVPIHVSMLVPVHVSMLAVLAPGVECKAERAAGQACGSHGSRDLPGTGRQLPHLRKRRLHRASVGLGSCFKVRQSLSALVVLLASLGFKLLSCCALLAAWYFSAFLSDFPCCSFMNASFSGFSGWHIM